MKGDEFTFQSDLHPLKNTLWDMESDVSYVLCTHVPYAHIPLNFMYMFEKSHNSVDTVNL